MCPLQAELEFWRKEKFFDPLKIKLWTILFIAYSLYLSETATKQAI
jgi:glycopeptide antibiotics resistance protein